MVSNAGILRRREYGAEIDANECVWRMNRAPTKGFERHVGARTTLDFVNSFPHLRNLHVLPRLDTQLVRRTHIGLQATTHRHRDACMHGHHRAVGCLQRRVRWPATPCPCVQVHGMTIELSEATVPRDGTPWAGFEKYMGWVDGHVKFTEDNPSHTVDVVDLAWMDRSWQAYWAYLAPFEPTYSSGRPSSGWHVSRLALETCGKVTMYGFSMEADDFHYFDSAVQEKVPPQQHASPPPSVAASTHDTLALPHPSSQRCHTPLAGCAAAARPYLRLHAQVRARARGVRQLEPRPAGALRAAPVSSTLAGALRFY